MFRKNHLLYLHVLLLGLRRRIIGWVWCPGDRWGKLWPKFTNIYSSVELKPRKMSTRKFISMGTETSHSMRDSLGTSTSQRQSFDLFTYVCWLHNFDYAIYIFTQNTIHRIVVNSLIYCLHIFSEYHNLDYINGIKQKDELLKKRQPLWRRCRVTSSHATVTASIPRQGRNL